MDGFRRRRLRVSRRSLLIAGAAFVVAVCLALGVAALVLPGVVRRLAETRLQAQLTVPARIGKVNLNLFTGRARLSGIAIEGLPGDPQILELPALDLGLSYRALLRGAITLRYLTFRGPKVFIARTGPESVNVIQALRQQEGGGALGYTIDQVKIEGGVVTFVDRTQTPVFERRFTDLSVTTGLLSTLPRLRWTPTSFEARLGIGRGALVVTGATAPFGRPAGIDLVARMEKLEPGLLKGYLPLQARIDLRDSWVDGEVRYRLAYQGNQAVENGLSAEVETGPVRFLPPDDDTPLVGFAGLTGRDITADFLKNDVRLGDLVVRGPEVTVERNRDGALNLSRLLAPPTPAAPAAPPAPVETPPAATPPAETRREVSVVLGRARLEGGTVRFVDRTAEPAVAATLRDLRAALDNLSFGPAAQPGRVEAEARLDPGALRVAGTVEGGTFATRGRITASGVALPALRGYLERTLPNAVTRDGTADARLDVVLGPPARGGGSLEVAGQVDVQRLAVALPGQREPVLRARRLEVELRRLAILPAVEVDLRAIRLAGASLRVRRERDGALDLPRLWQRRETPSEPPAPVAGEPGPSRSPMAVRRVELRDSEVRFTDTSVTPAFQTTLAGVTADVRQAREPGRLTVRLQGRADGSAPVEVTGWAAPFDDPLRFVLDAVLRDYEVAALNPYATQYVSQRIERGQTTTEVKVEYDGGRYQADSDIRIRHIRLGEDLGDEFNQRVGIPLGLAVSLLEDRHGEIHLRIPVSGTAEGRQIDLKPAIWEAVRHAVVNLVAAPFRLFGSILTLGGKIGELKIAPIDFKPGSFEPDDQAASRFAELVKFLEDKPRLALQLSGTATRGEAEPLKRELLSEKLKNPPPNVGEGPLAAAYREAGGDVTSTPRSIAETEEYIIEHTKITDDDLRRLAERRAHVIQDVLVNSGVNPSQLLVATRRDAAITAGDHGQVTIEIVR